ncbi:MAG: Ig-like domain-containing protein, partial [Bacteroidota bacterium]
MFNSFTKCKAVILIIALLSGNIAFSQNQYPVAVRDTASSLAEVPVVIPVLRNDYDPQGDTIKVYSYSYGIHGKATGKTDSTLTYVSYCYTGYDSLSYSIKDKQGNYSNPAYVVVHVLNNPSLPVAMNDSASTLAADSLLVNVTGNDLDPDGDSLEIDVSSGHYLTARNDEVLKKINDSVLLYRSIATFTGTDTIYYTARKKNHPSFYSNTGKVIVHVGVNPGLPVAVNDTVNYLSFSDKHIILLQNDLVPTQDSIQIIFRDLQWYTPDYVHRNNDLSIDYFDSVWNNDQQISIPYYIQRKHDHVYSSNTASLVIRYSHDPQFFYAKTDTLSCVPYEAVIHDLIANDYNPHPSDSLQILSCNHGDLSDSVFHTKRLVRYYANKLFGGTDKLDYS